MTAPGDAGSRPSCRVVRACLSSLLRPQLRANSVDTPAEIREQAGTPMTAPGDATRLSAFVPGRSRLLILPASTATPREQR